MDKYLKSTFSDKGTRYSEEFKKFICSEFMTGKYSLTSLSKKYSIGGNATIARWLKSFNYSTPKFVPSSGMSSELPKPSKKEEKSLSQLQRELEDAKLLAESYKKMIEIAEQQFKIKIIKKSNTK